MLLPDAVAVFHKQTLLKLLPGWSSFNALMVFIIIFIPLILALGRKELPNILNPAIIPKYTRNMEAKRIFWQTGYASVNKRKKAVKNDPEAFHLSKQKEAVTYLKWEEQTSMGGSGIQFWHVIFEISIKTSNGYCHGVLENDAFIG